MNTALEAARRDWEDGFRRLAVLSSDPVASERLHRQVDVLIEELRRRVGGTYTLGDLAEAYGGSDSWARQAIEEHAATPGWARTLAVVGDAAFHVYARGALDYEP